MVGNNSLDINQATMCRIVQKWANEEFKSKPKVSKVCPTSDIGSIGFTIEFCESKPVEGGKHV